ADTYRARLRGVTARMGRIATLPGPAGVGDQEQELRHATQARRSSDLLGWLPRLLVSAEGKPAEPADDGGGAEPVGVEGVDVAHADDGGVDAVGAQRGLAVVAVGVWRLLVGCGDGEPERRPWRPFGAGAVSALQRRGEGPGWVPQHLERVRGQQLADVVGCAGDDLLPGVLTIEELLDRAVVRRLEYLGWRVVEVMQPVPWDEGGCGGDHGPFR